MLPPPAVIAAEQFDEGILSVPNADAVFIVWAGDRSAYVAKTSMLRRRLQRILKPAEPGRKMLNLRNVATKVEYWLAGSRFESALLHYQVARIHYPETYLKILKLRMPAYVRLILSNAFPRTQATRRLGGDQSVNYGPFRSRASAEQFEAKMLELFQIRRCQEDLLPAREHPGCIYGEMNMCLRPCQLVVNIEQYRSEALRVSDFLEQNGKSMVQSMTAARDQLSEEMNFEDAARQHKMLERVTQVLSLRDELVGDVDRLHGVAISPAVAQDAVDLWFVYKGCWQSPVEFALTSHVSLDQRVRELIGGLSLAACPRPERQEHIALLARWQYSTWRDGEWIPFESFDRVPYRKLVRAISKQKAGQATLPGEIANVN